ncbi:hypothetical protein chiPu_0029077 [Chiloscyllium punctatum]|uniref:Uncharacterized protein n=1 Tax=Chiloscyllium punctatum TaxID=137246 RepID=A0A401TPX5_CHIPU|nr:hypothetical protein [Chiloscyllium punctatum]
MLRLATAAKFLEKYRTKEWQQLQPPEERIVLPEDPTHAVFDTPTVKKKPVIQLHPPPESPEDSFKKRHYSQRQRSKLRRKAGNAHGTGVSPR